jgi:hypothetical protein
MDPRDYLDVIDVPEGKSGRFAVEHFTEPAGKPFTTAPLRSAMFSAVQREDEEHFAFPQPTRWHRLREKGAVWMTDLPCEQAQMRDGLRHLRGNVLIGGLGLGVVANLACASPEIKSVTVIEKEPDVIALVASRLRDHGKSLLVVEADLYDYLGWLAGAPKDARPRYDSALFDTWAGDGMSVLFREVIPLRALAEKAGIGRVWCWQEDVMRGQLRMQLHHPITYKYAITHDDAMPADYRQMLLDIYDGMLPSNHPEHSIWTYPFAWAIESCHPDSLEEVSRMASDLADDFGMPGWAARWRIDPKQWERWLRLARKKE